MLYMLSTIDNPYNPHHDWERWLAYDHNESHYSSELLARIARTSEELSDTDYELSVNSAIDEIIKEDLTDMFIKVSPNFKPKPITLVSISKPLVTEKV